MLTEIWDGYLFLMVPKMALCTLHGPFPGREHVWHMGAALFARDFRIFGRAREDKVGKGAVLLVGLSEIAWCRAPSTYPPFFFQWLFFTN